MYYDEAQAYAHSLKCDLISENNLIAYIKERKNKGKLPAGPYIYRRLNQQMYPSYINSSTLKAVDYGGNEILSKVVIECE